MPVNFLDIFDDIKTMASEAPKLSEELQVRRDMALSIFNSELTNKDIKDKIDLAVESNTHIRCAIPSAEIPNRPFPLPIDLEENIIIAVDGSQINPTRHQAINYFLINIGIIHFPAQQNQTPSTKISTKLFSPHNTPSWRNPSDNDVAYIRDLEERKVLSKEANIYGANTDIITLTDGPLELWLRKDSEQGNLSTQLKPYLKTLVELKDLNAIAAGFVDKPRARLMVQSLELLATSDEDIQKADYLKNRDNQKFDGVTDADLFINILKNPGDRSAIFELQFSEKKIYNKTDTAVGLHFFYMNVGGPGSAPSMARVEIPKWVAVNPSMINRLHFNIYNQCNFMGDIRYPYVLHRAHETAVVKFEDRDEVDNLLIKEFAKHGIGFGSVSSKQSAKNMQTGKRRFTLGSGKY